MKRNFPVLLIAFLISFMDQSNAQSIKDSDVDYNFIKLPSAPISKSIKSYQSKIEAPFEAKNKEIIAAYELELQKANDEFELEKAAYPAKLKAAEDRYDKEMEDWKKKSYGEKIYEQNVLKENNKPVKQIPPQPYLRQVEKPKVQTSYDYSALASTYLILSGFEKAETNAVNIIVTMYGFDYTQPRVLSEQKSMTKISNGQSSNYMATYYHVEFSYREPLSVKVILPDGKEILNITPSEFNNYTIYKSSSSESYPQINTEMLIKTNEEKILQANLKNINDLVNEKFGFPKIGRKGLLFYVKSKGGDYVDLMTAFNETSSGLKILVDDEANAKTKINNSIELWKKALLESDPTNKKARIDKDVTIAIYFNLLEAYFALREVGQGFDVIKKLNTLDLSNKERKRKDEFEIAFNDLKKRVQTNL